MPGCIVSATTASFRSVEKRRLRATPVITSTFENVSDIGVSLGLYLGPPVIVRVRSKRGAVQRGTSLNPLTLEMTSILALALAACQQASSTGPVATPEISASSNFYSCVHREAKRAL